MQQPVENSRTLLITGKRVTVAPFKSRLSARVIDACLVSVFSFLITSLIWSRSSWYLADDSAGITTLVVTYQTAWVTLAFLYESLFLALFQKTPGKYFLHVRVVAVADGESLSRLAILIRCAVPTATMIVLIFFLQGDGDLEYVVILQALFNWLISALPMATSVAATHNRGVHDKAAGTIVIVD